MAEKRSREEPEDDGRTIADMNVDGMPWYTKGRGFGAPPEDDGRPPMAKEDRRAYVWAAVKAGLLVAAVFGIAYLLFLLFCDFVWFR